VRSFPLPEPGRPDTRSALRYLLWLARNQWTTVVLGALWGVLWMACLALLPAVLGRAIDEGVVTRDPRALTRWALVVLLLGAASAVTGLLRHRCATLNGLAASLRTAQAANRHLLEVGEALPRLIDSGDVVAVGATDIVVLGAGFKELPITVGALVAVGLVALVLLRTSLALGLIVILGAPAVMGSTALLVRPLRRRQAEYRRLQAELSGRATDIASGLRVLRGIGGERQFAAGYRRASAQARLAGFRVAGVASLLTAIQTFGPGAFAAAVTGVAATFAVRGEIPVGALVACYGYTTFLTLPLSTLAAAANLMTGAVVAAERVVRVLRLPVPPARPAAASPEPGTAAVAATGPGRAPALLADRASGLACAPGALLAVVCADPGESIALARRLAGFDDAAGASLDGVPVSSIPLAVLRARVLLAQNEDRIFAGSLRENLTPARPLGSAPRLGEALHAAAADDVLEFLDDGIDSLLDDGGRNLSGGQQQRVRLARALAAEPELLILVDPTSALDAHTENDVAERLARHRAGRSTVVFTRSPLLLDRADSVSYLEGGTVLARGTHRQLAAECAPYRRTVLREGC
jgi:ABC-type multidrug transport system fused ATPase/permease subunit